MYSALGKVAAIVGKVLRDECIIDLLSQSCLFYNVDIFSMLIFSQWTNTY